MPRIVTAPGIGNPFAVHDQQVGGGDVFLHTLYVEQGGVLVPLLDADGFRLPSKVVFADASGLDVAVANAALGTVRVEVEGGASVVPGAIDNAPFAPGQDGGVVLMYATGDPGVADPANNAAPRMSLYRIIHHTGPPRSLQVQTATPIRLTSTGEVPLLPAGGAGVYHDMRDLFVTTNYVEQQNPSIEIHLRDTTGGTIRWSVAISEKSGAGVPFPVHRKQTSPANAWTIQLSAAPPAGRAVIVNAAAEMRLD